MSVRGFVFRSRVPVNTTGTIASPAALSVATCRRWCLQSNAGVAGLPPEPYPEIAATGGACCERPSRRSCAASHRARHTTWREAVARTHALPRASLLAVTASDVRAHTTIGAAFKGVPSHDEGLKPT